MTAGHTILIVDGERDLVATCVRLLARRGYGCLPAYTGRDAMDRIARERPDLVLTEFSLPDIDGLSVLRETRKQSPPAVGVLMSGFMSPATIRRAFEAGAAFHLAKPFSNAALLETVTRALGGAGNPSRPS
jgi:CheY-like chemotaxis protein